MTKKMLLIAVVAALNCGLASAQRKETLEATYIDKGYLPTGLNIGTTRTPVGPVVTVDCPGTSGTCTIQADQFIQVGYGSASGNMFIVGFYLDGVNVIDEQAVGSIPTNDTYLVGATSESQAGVAVGTHTVQIYIYALDKTGSVFNYNTNFRVYRP
jgi:hypothetical protein